MPKYSKTRKINLSNYGGPKFETIDLTVLECDSAEQADAEITKWAREVVSGFLRPKPTPTSTPIEPDIEVKQEDIPF